MPPSARLHGETTAALVRPLLAKRTTNGLLAAKPRAENFEELAFRTLQALNPRRRIKRAEVPVDRVRQLLGRLLRGDASADVLRSFAIQTRRSNSTTSHSSSSAASTSPQAVAFPKRQSLPSPPLTLVTPRTSSSTSTSEHPSSPGLSCWGGLEASFSAIRRDSLDESTAESTVDESFEETRTPTAFDLLFERALDRPSALESTRLILSELRHPESPPQMPISDRTDQSLLDHLNAQTLPNQIDPRRSAEKNVQSVEVKILLELHKLRLAATNSETVDLQSSKLIPTLHYLNIITGGTHLVDFVRNVVSPEFGSSLPAVLRQLRDRLGVEMPEPAKSFSPVDVADLPPPFVAPTLNGAADGLKSGRDSADRSNGRISTTRRRRSNASIGSSISTLSSVTSSMGLPTLDRFSSAATPIGSKRASLAETETPELTVEGRRSSLQQPTRSASTRRRSSHQTVKSTASSDDQPPVLQRVGTLRSGVKDAVEQPSTSVSTRASKRKAIASLVKMVEEVDETVETTEVKLTAKRSRRVEIRGSIASRRQSNRRLCVIRQNVKDLILPTSRRSSTASLLQKQQPTRSLIQRFAGHVEKSQFASAQSSTTVGVPAKKSRVGSKENEAKSGAKSKQAAKQPLTPDILERYRQRMSNLYESAKQMDEHEVFYGRRNGRVDLFEAETDESAGSSSISPPEPSTRSQVKSKAQNKKKTIADSQRRQQKNRSRRSVKQTSIDCLYIAHTLLNVHNREPLASGRPRPSQLSNGTFAFGRDLKRASTDGQPFRVKRLLKHANRAKVLTLRRYLQRSQQQQLLMQIKKEKMEEEEVA